MVEVTQADMVAAEAQAKKHYQTAYDYEMDLREDCPPLCQPDVDLIVSALNRSAMLDQCNREGPYEAIGGAKRIRALIEEQKV